MSPENQDVFQLLKEVTCEMNNIGFIQDFAFIIDG